MILVHSNLIKKLALVTGFI